MVYPYGYSPRGDYPHTHGCVRTPVTEALRYARQSPCGRSTARPRLAEFDPVEFLDDEAVIAEYLSAAIEDPNPDVFLRAMANVARARGISEIAKASGLGRESLYKALAPGAKVRYETVRKVLDSLGVKLKVAA